MDTQATITSWAVVVAASLGGYWYYSSQHRPRRPDSRRPAHLDLDPATRRRVDNRPKRRDARTPSIAGSHHSDPLEVPAAQTAATSRRRSSKKRPELETASSARDSVAVSSHQDEAEASFDNRELARRLASAKAGTIYSPSSSASPRLRTNKQSKASGFTDAADSTTAVANASVSTASSATGPDADDDRSSANSPGFGAITPPTDSTGISDMLETPTAGPAILRVTEPTHAPRASAAAQKTKSSAGIQAESKKQRQRRRKNEERKLERDEAEQQRRALMEQQRRTAREAEGRPARNGGNWTYGQGPAPLAWKGTSGGVETTTTQPTAVPLLDTFEPVSSSASSMLGDGRPHAPATKATKVPESTGARTSAWANGLLSEEEQLRLLKEEQQQSAQWETVPTKKGAKRSRKETPATNGKGPHHEDLVVDVEA